MKHLLKTFIIIGLILAASHASAIDIRGFDTPIGPESLAERGTLLSGGNYLYSNAALRASLSPNLSTEDRGAILSELVIRNDFENGTIQSSDQLNARRQQYIDAFFHRNGATFNTGNLDTRTGLPPATSNNGGSGALNDNDLARGEEALPDCGWNTGCIILRAVAWLLWWVVRLFSLLVILANQIFNLAIDISVRQFNTYAELQGVKEAWAIFRDLVNISFIFVLLYVAIGTILQLNSVQGKHLLKNVIIAALLVNFSFFFTGIVIDASNVVANQFYSMAGGENPTGLNGAPDITTSLIDGMKRSYYEDIVAWRGNDSDSTLRQFGSILTSYASRIILMLITATVLFAGAVMFFVRTIVLIFVLVLSPVAFLGFAIGGDGLGKLAKKWQSALTNQVIFAPVYLLLILMTVKLVNSGGLGAAANSGALGSLVVFAIINGLMLGSLMIAKELGVAGAALGTKLGGGITGFGAKVLGRTVTGGIGGAGKGLYGGIAQIATGKDRAGNDAPRLAGLGLVLRSPGSGAIAGGKAGINAANTGSGFIKTATNTLKKPGEAINETLADATGIKILGATRDDVKEAAKKAKEEKEAKEAQNLDESKENLKKIGNEVKSAKDAGKAIEPTRQTEIEKEVQKVKEKNVVKLDPETMQKLAGYMSDSQAEAIYKNEEVKAEDKNKFRAAREEPLRSALNSGNTVRVKEVIGKMSAKTIQHFLENVDESSREFENVLSVISSLNPETFKKIINSDNINVNRLERLAGARPSAATSAGVQASRSTSSAVANLSNVNPPLRREPPDAVTPYELR